MKHAAMTIWNGSDGTPREMANAAVGFFAKRMPVLVAESTFDHQGHRRSGGAAAWWFFQGGVESRLFDAATEWDHRNCALAWMRAHWKPERIWIVDTDEFYSEADFEGMRRAVEEDSESAAYFTVRQAYWKGLNWRISPPEPHHSLVVVNVERTLSFVHIRTAAGRPDSRAMLMQGPVQHHLTAVRSDAEMKRKWECFSHAHQMLSGWYEEKWLAWTPEMEDLHPTDGPLWKRAVPCLEGDLPESLRPLYKLYTHEVVSHAEVSR